MMPLFRIDVLDTNDNKVGEGPLTWVQSVALRRSLDRMGGAEIQLMATDPRTALIGAGRRYRIHHREYGLLGTFRHASQSLAAGREQPGLAVKADDRLIELVHKNGYFRRNFNNVAVNTVVGTLVALVPSWVAGSVETGIGNTTVSYEGESIFEALDVLRDRWGRHFRLGQVDRTLDFGAFGEASGLRLIRAEGVPGELAANDEVALVTDLEIVEESEAVINRLIPVGAGAGTTQLTLQNVTSADAAYPVKTGTNGDGSSFYYIEDATSQAAYGLVERPFERPDIRPLTNATANLQNAANALYRAALAMLLRWKDPRTHYRVSVTKLDPARLRPGNLARLVYRGIARQSGLPYKWVDVDEELWVLDIEERYDQAGRQQVTLTVATSGDRRTQDDDVLAGLMRDVKVWKTHVQPNLTHSPTGPYIKRMNSSNGATFNIRLKEEVLAVNRVILRFITSPLRSSVTASANESAHTHSVTIGSSGSHSHTVTIGSSGSHSHTVTIGSSGSHSHDIDHQHEIHIQEKGATPWPAMHLDTITPNMRYDGSGGTKTVFTDVIDTSTSDSASHSHPATATTSDSHSHPATATTSDSHSHPATATTAGSAHNHAMAYGLFQDTVHPQVISISINGVDRTSALGGTWAPTNAAVDVEVDITQYINRGQDNTVAFTCTTGQGEITFLADCLLTIQAIAVT